MGTLESITGKNHGLVLYFANSGLNHIVCDWSGKKGFPKIDDNGKILWDGIDVKYSGDPKYIKNISEYMESKSQFGGYYGEKAEKWIDLEKKNAEGLVYSFEEYGIKVIVFK
jgi:hypothetical protein